MEKLNIKAMIESVIEDLSNNVDVSQFALKVKLIASKLKNPEFSAWVKNELEGYDSKVELPSHRIIDTQIVATVLIQSGFNMVTLTNHVMPLINLMDIDVIKQLSVIKINESVLSLEQGIKIQDKEIGYSLTEWERSKISGIYANSTINSAHKTINQASLGQIVYNFKSTLLEMFMAFDDNIFNDELDFDIMAKKQEIEKVVNQTINTGQYFNNSSATFNDSPVVTGDNNTINMSSTIKSELSAIIDKIEELSNDVENDREDIAVEIVKIRQELDNTIQQPKLLRSAFNAIKGITIGVAANQITPLVNEALSKL
jgi:hypothetical protein